MQPTVLYPEVEAMLDGEREVGNRAEGRLDLRKEQEHNEGWVGFLL